MMLTRWLFRAAALRHHQDPTFAQLIIAEIAMLCFSVGGILLTLGTHIFDPVKLSARWIIWRCGPAEKEHPLLGQFLVGSDDAMTAAFARYSAGQRSSPYRRSPWDAGGHRAII